MSSASDFSHAFANLLKTMIGSGLLTLPWITAQAGIGLSVPGLACLAYLTQGAIRFVVRCAAHERQLAGATYVDLDKPSEPTDHGGSSWQIVAKAAFGQMGWMVTSLSLLTAQLGVASSYLNFVGNAVMEHTGVSTVTSRIWLWGFVSLLCMVRPLKSVAYLSMTALLVYAGIIILVFVFGTEAWLERERAAAGAYVETDAIKLFDASQLGTWFGPALFAFEGMGTALSIYESMGTNDVRPFFAVISSAYTVAVLVYTSVAGFGYLAWRGGVESVVLDSFPRSAVGYGAQFALTPVLALTYPIQMAPVFQMADRACAQCTPLAVWPLVRVAFVGLTCSASYAIPDMEKMVGLTGALAFSSIGFVLPGLFFLKLRPPALTPGSGGVKDTVLAVALVVIGLIGGAWGVHTELS